MDSRSIHPALEKRTNVRILAAVVLGACGLTATAASATERDASVDGACGWGRLADGKGKLVRCLTREEALRLRDAAPAPVASSDATKPAAGASAEAAGVLPASPEPGSPPEAPASAPPPESALAVEIGPVVADEGALPEALRSLRKPKDRYAECVDKNGGLTAERGEIELRFLVQGRGRAEGVSVKKRRGLGEVAAKCVAGVVDRRYVGYPEAPTVGATVLVSVMKKKR